MRGGAGRQPVQHIPPRPRLLFCPLPQCRATRSTGDPPPDPKASDWTGPARHGVTASPATRSYVLPLRGMRWQRLIYR